jgi:hypothetical protein
MIISIAFVSLLLSSAAPPQSRPPAPDATVSCTPTPAENLLTVVGPMAGSRPAWFVDGGEIVWTHAEHPVKTLWVVARTSETVRIKGRRLDGAGTARFRQGQEEPQSVFVIADASAASAIPGGASADVMRTYSFLPSHVFYSSPGCWEFIVRVGSDEVRLVREVKAPPTYDEFIALNIAQRRALFAMLNAETQILFVRTHGKRWLSGHRARLSAEQAAAVQAFIDFIPQLFLVPMDGDSVRRELELRKAVRCRVGERAFAEAFAILHPPPDGRWAWRELVNSSLEWLVECLD